MSRQLDCDPAFVEAVMRLARHKDGKPLVAMLLAGYPKNDDERLLLAAYHRGDLKRRPGRPADDAVINAAELYRNIRHSLDKLLRETGGRFLKKRSETAIECAFACLREHGYDVPDQKKLENFLRRSKKPRIKR